MILSDAFAALRTVFPNKYYRQINPALIDFDDGSLVRHFCRVGLQQDHDLSEETITRQLHSFPSDEVQKLRVRVKELEQLLDASIQQLSSLQNALSEVAESAEMA